MLVEDKRPPKLRAAKKHSEVDVAEDRVYVEVGVRRWSGKDEQIVVAIFALNTAFRACRPKWFYQRDMPANDVWRRDHLDQWQPLRASRTLHPEIN